MNLSHLILREMLHRKVNTLLSFVSVVAAVACLVAGLTLLRGHDLETDRILTDMAQQSKAQLAALRAETEMRTNQLLDDYRKIVLELGFNVFILPKEANLAQGAPGAVGSSAAQMPYEFVRKLADADIITIEHLLPSLSAPVFWKEQKAQITLTGIHGEVAKAGKKAKKPLIQPVEPGQIVLGYSVATQHQFKPGDKIALLDESFTVTRVHDFRGTSDDHTVWIDLKQAQKMLGKDGVITAIQAINCLAPNCHPDATGIPSVTQEIAKVLPQTQVIIDMGKAKTRIDARQRAAAEARAALEQEDRRGSDAMRQETSRRAQLRGEMEGFASVLIPIVILGCGLWIGLLAMNNARERRGEIGILRALGLGSAAILKMFLGKAVIIGLAGAALGYGTGLAAGAVFSASDTRQLADASLPLAVLIAAPLLATLAAWLPAMLAAQQDPATVLGAE